MLLRERTYEYINYLRNYLAVLPTLSAEFDDLALERDGEHVLVVLVHADGGRDVQAAGERRAVDRVVAEGGAAVLVELQPALALVVHAERHPQLLCLRRLRAGREGGG